MNIEALENWNPWWASKEVPQVLKGMKRNIDPLIFRSVKEKEIIILTGVRRCGKTTIMYQMMDSLLKGVPPAQILYLNLDDEVLKKESLEYIYSAYRQYKNPDKKAFVFLDEIQNIPGWE
ncbi:AAA domain protein [uncultured archaeon]|nr:AAA domain protein [uncultured archaeon]